MRKIIPVIGIHLFLFPLLLRASVFSLEVNDVIHPVTAEYIIQGITRAEAEKAEAVIIRLSTPGGLDQSMREIIEKILASKVPVIVYVAPSGVRAASAGFYILLSADLAVMAPGVCRVVSACAGNTLNITINAARVTAKHFLIILIASFFG